MNGVAIALSTRVVSIEVVARLLSEWFPEIGNAPRAEVLKMDAAWPPVVFALDFHDTATDFPTLITFDCFPGPDEDAVAVGVVLARRFATALGCRSLSDGTGFGEYPAPYWDVIWMDGASFLADDCNTAFADGEGGAVRVVRPLQTPSWDLARDGKLLKP